MIYEIIYFSVGVCMGFILNENFKKPITFNCIEDLEITKRKFLKTFDKYCQTEELPRINESETQTEEWEINPNLLSS